MCSASESKTKADKEAYIHKFEDMEERKREDGRNICIMPEAFRSQSSQNCPAAIFLCIIETTNHRHNTQQYQIRSPENIYQALYDYVTASNKCLPTKHV